MTPLRVSNDNLNGQMGWKSFLTPVEYFFFIGGSSRNGISTWVEQKCSSGISAVETPELLRYSGKIRLKPEIVGFSSIVKS